jgi:hypothetical protein
LDIQPQQGKDAVEIMGSNPHTTLLAQDAGMFLKVEILFSQACI